MRITTSMVQRNVLSDLNGLSEKLSRTQGKASSGKEITRASDDPFDAAKAIGLRQTLEANDQYVRNIEDAQGWQDATESALESITVLRQPRATTCWSAARPTRPTRPRATRSPPRSTRSSRASRSPRTRRTATAT